MQRGDDREEAERNKLSPQLAEYILGLYQFRMSLTDAVAEGAKVEEAWLRSKDRLKGNPIDWTKVINRTYFDKAMAAKWVRMAGLLGV